MSTPGQNGQPEPKHLGVTQPISEAFPTKEDEELTNSLEVTLRAQGLEVVLGQLDKMVKEFVYKISLRRNLPESVAREAGGKIFTFGSYRLGVHAPGKSGGSDIDTLCVVPHYVQREDFFSEMHDMLRKRSDVTELTAVSDAFTPVIKMKFSDIHIDLTFARLRLSSVQDTLDLKDNGLLRELDDRCIRSVNGSRVTDEILRLVPNVRTFRIALRTIKLWAHRRAIYSNMLGFLGGIAWAMLVARICQLYPNACAATIISRFFTILYKWPWPQPVLLKHIEEGPLQVRVWNPKLYSADRSHRMPIITPAYPSMCSTHNVTDSTKAVILSEFKDAAELVNRIVVEKLPWTKLFTKDDFFTRYRHYLQVIASSDSEEKHLRWSGLVESRIRHLVMKLERIDNIVLAHPYVKGFSKVIQYTTPEEKDDAAHGIVKADKPERPADAEVKTMYTTTFYIGLCIPAREAGSTAPRKLDLYKPKEEFTDLVMSWEPFDNQSMHIVVQHIRSVSLPAEVFEDGDQKKAKRTKSGKKASGTDARPPNKKRRGSAGQNGVTASSEGAAAAATKNPAEASASLAAVAPAPPVPDAPAPSVPAVPQA
ncbi:polynucleotide adenylyltransferase [Lunasporangiospora selenospora]|uniref:Poly(A) polymerase n=1 Tax=Lunasporangiospora selenospora TaxID=979761 RepID=A0A9P6FP54_9FUNG|nr:polynucleotide adenylyltransferase [Lunasporangiospora selenospora]